MDSVKLHRIFLFSLLIQSLITIPLTRQKSVSAGYSLQTVQHRYAQIENSDHFQSRPEAGIFILRRDRQSVICHDASPLETQALRASDASFQLHVLMEEPGSADQLHRENGLTIILRGTDQLENNPQAKAALMRAAATWMGLIKNKITLIIDTDFGTTRFGEVYPADVLGVTRTQEVGAVNLYPEVRKRFLNTATNPREALRYNALPQDSLQMDSRTSKNIAAPTAVFRSLGLLSPNADPAGEITTLGALPAISFNSAFNFDFDSSDGIDVDKIDFEGLALHQIGHLLGFLSEAAENAALPTKPLFVTTWDMVRFQPGTLTGSFTTAQRISTPDPEQKWFASDNHQPFIAGRLHSKNGDDEPASHWKPTGSGSYLGIMEPAAHFGQRLTITQNDLEALEYIGHAINVAPAADNTIALTSGTPLARTMPEPSPDACILDTVQYTIEVPNNAIELQIDLAGTPNLDLFVRINGYVVVYGSDVYANFISVSEDGNESITVTAAPSSVLPSGTYYIAVGNCGEGAGQFTLTATVTKPSTAPAINTFAARLDGDLLKLTGTATDADGDIVKASIKLLNEAGSEMVTLANVPVNMGTSQSGNYSISLNGLSQTSALSVVRANLTLIDAKGNRSSAMSAAFNQADAGGAFIKNVSFDADGGVMVFKGSPFASAMQVEINGVIVTPPLFAKLKGAKIKLPGTAAQFGLRTGANRVRLLLNGAYSNLFVLRN